MTEISFPFKGSAGASDEDPALLEREAAIAIDENMKKESVRASVLSELLQQRLSLPPDTLSKGTSNICPYLSLCERYKDHLVVKHSMIALAPENGSCFCEQCERKGEGQGEGQGEERQVIRVAGNPPQQYALPLGWAQFIHR